MRYVRKLAARVKRDPAELDEAQLRAHLLHLKDGKDGHGYSASSMRTAVAAFTAFYNLHLGRDWKLFRLVRSPSPQTLPTVLTRDEVKRLFRVIREQRFRVILRLIYMCGLRVSEAIALEVTDIKRDGPHLHLKKTKFSKERLVPLPAWVYRELQDYWKTHRHPRWVFPGVGRGWRETPGGIQRLHQAVEPMGVSSIQYCVRLARADAKLPKSTHVHTLRHSYATHLLEEGVSIRLISAYLGHASLDGARMRGDGRSNAQARGEAEGDRRGCPLCGRRRSQTTLIYVHLTAVNEASARAALEKLRPDDATA